MWLYGRDRAFVKEMVRKHESAMKTLRLGWAPSLILVVLSVFLMLRQHSPSDATESVIAIPPSAAVTHGAEPAGIDASGGAYQDTITFWARIGVVEFPHKMHSEDFGMDCVECHHETNAAKLDMPHQDYFDDFWIDCSTCHKSNGDTVMEPQACSTCHHTDPTGIADESLSSKVVIHKLCWECHDSGTGQEASESCISCHSGEKTSFMVPLPDSLRVH